MGKKSKRIRTKQTKEEKDKAKNIMVMNLVVQNNLGKAYINKKYKKRMDKFSGKRGKPSHIKHIEKIPIKLNEADSNLIGDT